MAYGLIALIILLAIFGFGFGGGRLVERKLDGVGSISLPSSVVPWGHGKARDEDPSRLYFRFGHEYPWWISMGSGSAYKQIVCVSFFTLTAGAADYEDWPPRFEPSYRDLKKERTLTLGTAQLEISGGHYTQNALDEPSHVYLYWDQSRRMQIAWHAADKVVAPDKAVKIIQQMAASFKLVNDPREKFTDLPETPNQKATNMSNNPSQAVPEFNAADRAAFGINLQTGDKFLDSLRQRLAAAAYKALPDVRAGHFDAADAAVKAVDRDIQASVMLGAMYTSELQAAVDNGEKISRPEFVTALYGRALRWRLSSYPEPHTQYEADDYAAGREADRAELDAILSGAKSK